MLVSLSAFSAVLGLLGREPPTTVNWAPRKIALGSKFDIETSGSCYESRRKSNGRLGGKQVKEVRVVE